ncbi:MAG: hypothetical protein L6R40_003479 [Gallowayella cf. fulva]|nr:MAG: hypothetical protein L6R40_003479 [Xanthomendoza cf. fulva]
MAQSNTISIANFTQERLGVFVVTKETSQPFRKVPIYAELLVSNEAYVTQDRDVYLPSGLAAALEASPLSEKLSTQAHLKKLTEQAAAELVDWTALSEEDSAQARINFFVEAVIARYQVRHWLNVPENQTASITDVRSIVSFVSARLGIINRERSQDNDYHVRKESVPLGVLATVGHVTQTQSRNLLTLNKDFTGFVSFDLSRLSVDSFLDSDGYPDNKYLVSIFIYYGLLQENKVNVLDIGRAGRESIVGFLELPKDYKGRQNSLSLPALQNPHIIDWRLSPGSFASVPQTLIGTDGCESFTPANFAVTRFSLRQVHQIVEHSTDPDGALKIQPLIPETYPSALVLEYTVIMRPIGHSLGGINYSLPLAPGESVRLAVIDWRRTDTGARTEETSFNEGLVHDQTRDRVVSETIKAAMQEWQRGGSIMGGHSGGAGGAASMGSYGAAGGVMDSLGGAYTTSKGSRDISVDTTQKVADAMHQASNSVRELYSSTVVQVTQAEKQNVETRFFANNNRGHAMTILYYEMLRHFHLTIRLNKVTEAVLVGRENLNWKTKKANGTGETPTVPTVPGPGPITVTWSLESPVFLLAKRYVLEPALLDESLRDGFDALMAFETARRRLDEIYPEQTQFNDVDPAQFMFNKFFFIIDVTEGTDNMIEMRILKKDRSKVVLTWRGANDMNTDGYKLQHSGTAPWYTSDVLQEAVKWGDIQYFQWEDVSTSGNDDFTCNSIKIEAYTADGKSIALRSYDPTEKAGFVLKDGEGPRNITINQPPAKTFANRAAQLISAEEYNKARVLIEHLVYNQAYYKRVLDLTEAPESYAELFSELKLGTGTNAKSLSTEVSPIPIDVLGSKIAFPRLDTDKNIDAIRTLYSRFPKGEQRLLSLPARGLFAEAKLGHCNVAEEIDETRFWRWDEHPLPNTAPEISPVQVVLPENKPIEGLDPTKFPAPIINIQQPQALPEPAGAAAALKAITTPEVFRDMSGAKQVQALLHDLTEGAVKMAQAASTNLANSQKNQTAQTQGARDHEAKMEQIASDERKAAMQQTSPADAKYATQVADNLAAQGKITEEERNRIAKNQVGNMRGSQDPPKPTPPTPQLPPKDPLAARHLQVIVHNFDNAPFPGVYQVELLQNSRSLEGSVIAPAEYPEGVIEIGYKPIDARPSVVLKLTGEIRAGPNAGLKIKAETTSIKFPLDLWEKYDSNTVVIRPWTDKKTLRASSSNEVISAMSASLGGEAEVLPKLAKITGGYTYTWTPGEGNKTTGQEEELTAYIYRDYGGVEVVEVS